MDEGGSRNPFLRLFSKKKTDDEQMEQEIISMVDEAHEQGALRESESMMIHNVLALDEKEAKDIMTHRKNIVAIDGNTPFSKAMDFIIEETHSRFPVYEEDIDNIIGAIHIREVLMYAKDPSVQNMPIKDIPNLIFEVDFIPETKNLDALFKEMQMEKSHIVIVVDEYGQTAGIVALEDILEEIVGNILDEHDEEEHTIEQLTEDTWMMQGMTPLDLSERGKNGRIIQEKRTEKRNYICQDIPSLPISNTRKKKMMRQKEKYLQLSDVRSQLQ